jgi:hypothetical protein
LILLPFGSVEFHSYPSTQKFFHTWIIPSMAQYMRHEPLDIFAPICCGIHGECILTAAVPTAALTPFLSYR